MSDWQLGLMTGLLLGIIPGYLLGVWMLWRVFRSRFKTSVEVARRRLTALGEMSRKGDTGAEAQLAAMREQAFLEGWSEALIMVIQPKEKGHGHGR